MSPRPKLSQAPPTLASVFEWLGVLDFFNNREKAILLWTVGLGVFAAIKSDGLGGSFLSVLGALASPKLLLLFGSARSGHLPFRDAPGGGRVQPGRPSDCAVHKRSAAGRRLRVDGL